MKKPKGCKPSQGDYDVTMVCTVRKLVHIIGCTEAQARSIPWNCDVVDEQEVEQIDWKVLSVVRTD